ncbi:hypothetical protein [Ilumatobacter coccineus]|uniref:Uncharacterized protein n=1 Tax=Ilumatobacter coccineus (strain NBRC 103263 / KCTC 29153 / YM16-304) TaxID=1313172 RepID=A0A6C7EDM1_ILUCY|nr:hypothetical protein [Ilumatobacter coccineus]BAN02718.1 hypothetical protein YM304_24040 [Ilumatobacter coccineus YM16-304]
MITTLLVIAVVAVVGFGVALAVRSKQEFSKQNEVVPGRKSPAPASWAGAHSREAKLHRRLGDAVKGARQNPRFVELGLAAQMNSIEAEALAIDERLVAAASLPAAHRDAAIDPLEAHVDELEATIATMITGITVADSKELLEQAVSAADIRLEALAKARAEIEQVDRAASGVVDPPPMPAPDPDDQPGTATA